jgi:hypothetical protein
VQYTLKHQSNHLSGDALTPWNNKGSRIF